eukprot:TRINITY_DN3107_c0_g1_i4.p1 TRINITY_DN3107_c0_g1~~TRINITY_DN3107_c0_g1_i4.p1  ORF type:complete len:438 (+),score=36.92 TRINITY_DN3107_c0_g1_i4:1646-2959(+)
MSCGDLTSLPLEVLCAVFSHLGNRDLFAVLSSCAYVDDAFRGDSSQEGWFLMYQRLKGRKEAFRSLHWKLQYMQELLLRRGFLHASSITSSLMDDSDPQIIIDDESSWCWFVSENKPLIGHHLKQLSRIQLPVTPRDDVKKILTIDTFSYVIVYSSDRVSLASTLMPNVTPLCPLSYGRAFASDFIFCDTRGVWIETPSKLQNRLFEVNRFRESLKEVRGINSSESSSLFPSHVLGLHVGSVRRKMIIIGSPGLLSLWDFSNFRFCTLLELDFDISELIPGWGEAHFFVVRKENNSSHCFYHFEITCEEKEVSEERLSVFSVVKTQSINCERSLTDYKVGSHVLVFLLLFTVHPLSFLSFLCFESLCLPDVVIFLCFTLMFFLSVMCEDLLLNSGRIYIRSRDSCVGPEWYSPNHSSWISHVGFTQRAVSYPMSPSG